MHLVSLIQRHIVMFARRLCMCCADTLRWRQEAKIEDCLETFLPDDKDNKLRRFLPSGFVGLDKAVSNVSFDQSVLRRTSILHKSIASLRNFNCCQHRSMHTCFWCYGRSIAVA